MGKSGGVEESGTMKAAPWLLASTDDLVSERCVDLEPAEARHAAGALRLRPGKMVVLADGRGRVAEAELVTVGSRSVQAVVQSVAEHPRTGGAVVTLAVGVVAGRAMDWAVQKAVEVGVGAFVPILAERSWLGSSSLGTTVAF